MIRKILEYTFIQWNVLLWTFESLVNGTEFYWKLPFHLLCVGIPHIFGLMIDIMKFDSFWILHKLAKDKSVKFVIVMVPEFWSNGKNPSWCCPLYRKFWKKLFLDHWNFWKFELKFWVGWKSAPFVTVRIQ